MGKIKFKNVTKIELTEEQYEILSDAITIMGEVVEQADADGSIPPVSWMEIRDRATYVKQYITDFINSYCEKPSYE